jgi:hypothetical protein
VTFALPTAKPGWKGTLCALAIAFSLVMAGAPVPPGGGDVAVVVRPDLPVDDLSFADVRKLLMGDRQFWTTGVRVTLLMRAPVAREREVILKAVYRMTEAEFKRYWIEKVFRAEATSQPRFVYSNETATELVGAIPGAVAFVDAARVPKGLKVVRIDGLLPGDRGYPLR